MLVSVQHPATETSNLTEFSQDRISIVDSKLN